jgi:hypothetical protein
LRFKALRFKALRFKALRFKALRFWRTGRKRVEALVTRTSFGAAPAEYLGANQEVGPRLQAGGGAIPDIVAPAHRETLAGL